MFSQELQDYAVETRLAINKRTPTTIPEFMAVLDYELAWMLEEEMYANTGKVRERDPWALKLDQALHAARERGYTPDYGIFDGLFVKEVV